MKSAMSQEFEKYSAKDYSAAQERALQTCRKDTGDALAMQCQWSFEAGWRAHKRAITPKCGCQLGHIHTCGDSKDLVAAKAKETQ